MDTIHKLKCQQCKKKITRTAQNFSPNAKHHFCSKICQDIFRSHKIKCKCSQCNKSIFKVPSAISKSKSGNHFCSKSCAAIYNNTHKKHGTRRSKLEIWLEKQLPKKYPKLEFHFNRKDTINSELDIYIPKLKLAFELNGIFHYEPIYGTKKLAQIQNNDNRKFQACHEKKIELCIIDVSSLNYFKEDKAQKYLKIICDIINHKY